MKGVDSNDELNSFPSVKGISLMCKSLGGVVTDVVLATPIRCDKRFHLEQSALRVDSVLSFTTFLHNITKAVLTAMTKLFSLG